MGADAATGLPQDCRGGGDIGPVVPGPASVRAGGEGARRAAQQPDRRLAVDAGDGDDLVQELPLLGAGRAQVALALNSRVLPKAGSCHGLLLAGVGNRDF